MQRNTSTLKSAFWFLFTLISVSVQAQTLESVAIDIASGMYHIDHKKHMILINQNAQEINAAHEESIASVSLDKSYTFADKLDTIEIGKEYTATHANEKYSIFFTQLPIIDIKTRYDIVDDPRVHATFSLAETNGDVLTSNIGIEIRGGYSQTYPKKSYRISFQEDTAGLVSRDVSLLHMRSDDDWNLQALYNEPMRVRSKSANQLWQEVHQIYYKKDEPEATNGIKMEYAELFLNNEYKGLYAIGERIDRKQLKLKKYDGKIKGELYKGDYWEAATNFTSAPAYDNTSPTWAGFEYEYPDEIIEWKNIHDFIEFATTSTDEVFYLTYKQRFHLDNAVDYFIFLNVLRAGDNTGKNIYIAKYKAGEPYYFVPWDLDGVFGTDWEGNKIRFEHDILSNKFYDRLLKDYSENGFRARLKQRWEELRKSIITEENILAKLNDNKKYLEANAVYSREHIAWEDYTLDTTQPDFTTTWLASRLQYLDNYFNQSFTLLASTQQVKTPVAFSTYPNPASGSVSVNIEEKFSNGYVTVRSMSGKVVLQKALDSRSSQVDILGLPTGLYLITVQSDKFVGTQKLLIN